MRFGGGGDVWFKKVFLMVCLEGNLWQVFQWNGKRRSLAEVKAGLVIEGSIALKRSIYLMVSSKNQNNESLI